MEPAGKQEDAEDFFTLFERLETAMGNALGQGWPDAIDTRGRREPSFQHMLRTLYHNGCIDRALFNTLMQIGRYRTLAQYGRLRRVDTAIIDQTRVTLARVEALSPSSVRIST